MWKRCSIWEKIMLVCLVLGGLLYTIGAIGKLIMSL